MSYSGWSNVATQTIKFKGKWISKPTDHAGTLCQFPYGGVGTQHGVDRAKTAMQYVGRQYPVYDVGEARAETVNVTAQIAGEDPNAPKQYALAESIGRNADVVLYRDGRGRKFYAMPSDWSATDVEMGGYDIAFTLNRVDYSEGFAAPS
jgi:hypothetical protein